MIQIPDAPWIQNPEPYIEEYYGKPVFENEEESEEEES